MKSFPAHINSQSPPASNQGPHSRSGLKFWWTCSLILLMVIVALALSSLRMVTRGRAPEALLKPKQMASARLSEEITVHAAGRGNPWVSLGDGHNVITAYDGGNELRQALEQNQARPLSLASADFDEDGVLDLISGYDWSSRGIIALGRGNVDSIYPNTPEAVHRKAHGTFADAPFLSPARVFSAPEAPDFMVAGDFDGDSHFDVVTVAHGSNKLFLLSGDGHGDLSEAKEVPLPGRVTAMVTGEINRRDGLDDLVVSVASPDGAKVMVFEGPGGALNSKPEEFPMSAEVTSLALGYLDDSLEIDLTIAAGRELMIIHGRDRKLSLDEIRRAEVPDARISARSFGFPIRSIVTGEFTGNQSTDIAVLSDEGEVHLLTQGPIQNQKADKALRDWKSKQLGTESFWASTKLVCARVSSVPIDNILVADSKSRSLHIVADGAAGLRRETGNVNAKSYRGVSAMLNLEEEPMAVFPMRLNGDSLDDLVILTSRQSSPNVSLTEPQAIFTVDNPADSGQGSLRQAILNGNSNPGADQIVFTFAMTITPLTALPTITEALSINGSGGGSGKAELNGSNFPAQPGTGTDGLKIFGGNSVVMNLVINRFGDDGIELAINGGNTIAGNFIGTDSAGNLARANSGAGVFINGSPNNTIGGTVPAARNVISGQTRADNVIQAGIQILGGGAISNRVLGNFIGTDASGSIAIANERGVEIRDASRNSIGGPTAGARNIVSGNQSSGVFITGNTSSQNTVEGNFIGPNAAGLGRPTGGGSFPRQSGVFCDSPGNILGGTISAARNVISGNSSAVVICSLRNGAPVLVQGNFIGTDATGTTALGNSSCGVTLDLSDGHAVGGATAGAGNLISGNASSGISISGSKNNQVQNNFIGTSAAGNAPLPNTNNGVSILPTFPMVSTGNLIGGSSTAGNRIAFNGGHGVFVASDSGNSILANSIFSNSLLGISFSAPDASDPSPPTLVSVSSSGGNAIVAGTLNSTPNTTFRLDFFSNTSNTACDASGYGEGERFLDFTTITTDGRGNAAFSKAVQLAGGQRVAATATDPKGTTSEFSNCVQGNAQGADPFIRIVDPQTSRASTGSLITYTIKIRNGGSTTASAVTFRNVTPAGSVFVFVEASQGSSSTPPFLGTGTVTCVIGSLNPGASATIELTLKVTASTPGPFDSIPLTNIATISSASPDSNLANNTASVTTNINGGSFFAADLSVTSTPSSTTVAAGTRLSYTVTISNPGPDPAADVGVVDVIPPGATFASINSSSLDCTTPPVGRNGLIVCGPSFIPAGSSLSFSFTVNVLEAPGSMLMNHATSLLGGVDSDRGNVCAVCSGGIPLQRTGTDDPNANNNTGTLNSPIQGGSIVILSWNQPTLNPGGLNARNAAPSNLQVRPSIGLASEQALQRIVIAEDDDTCFLARVNIYKSDLPRVQPITNNLWRSVPPEQVQSTMASAPAGSFYVLTNLWNCGGAEIESGVSNECSSTGSCTGGTGPRIGNVEQVGKHLIITGANFVTGSKILIEGAQKKTVFESSTRLKGKKLGKTTSRGANVKVRNPDGATSNEWIY